MSRGPGRPRKYSTDADRKEARRQQVRDALRTHRHKKAQLREASKTLQVDTSIATGPTQSSSEEQADLSSSSSTSVGVLLENFSEKSEECSPPEDEVEEEETVIPVVNEYAKLGFLNFDPVLEGNSDARQLFHYFRTQGVSELTLFKTDFWAVVVPRSSYFEPAVRHAALALASLHQGFTCELEPSSEQNIPPLKTDKSLQHTRLNPRHTTSTWTVTGLRHYNAAIHLLMHSGTNAKTQANRFVPRLDVTLICCVLFVCIDSLLGNDETAFTHIKHGLNMLKTYDARRRSPGTTLRTKPQARVRKPRSPSPSSSHATYAELLKVYQTLDLCARASLPHQTGGGKDWPRLSCAPITALSFGPSFLGVEDAYEGYVQVLSNFLNITDGLDDHARFRHCLPLLLYRPFDTLVKSWWTAFNTFVEQLKDSDSPSQDPKQRAAILTLHVYMSISSIHADAKINNRPFHTYYTAQLRQLVEMCKEVIVIQSFDPATRRARKVFQMEIGVISSLHYISILSHDEAVKREALEVMRLAKRREGLWSTEMAEGLIRVMNNLY